MFSVYCATFVFVVMWSSISGAPRPATMSPPSLVHASKLVIQQGRPQYLPGEEFSIFTKYVKVFDLYFVATTKASDNSLLHGASVLYQYLDSTDTGSPDNEAVYQQLKKHRGTMVMFESEDEMEKHIYLAASFPRGVLVQSLQSDETRPGSLDPYEFDAAIEECFHLVTQGYRLAYPDVFGLERGSEVGVMMDRARGGFFDEIPVKYPEGAWYTYYDDTCDYGCQILEYVYWAFTTMIGAQKLRCEEIVEEWRPCTPEQLQAVDSQVVSLLSDPVYKFPNSIPRPTKQVELYVGSEEDDDFDNDEADDDKELNDTEGKFSEDEE